MPSRVFEAYAEEHAELCASAGRSIAQLRELTGADRKATQSEAESTLSKAEELVQQMELEARSNGAKGPEAKELQAAKDSHPKEANMATKNMPDPATSGKANKQVYLVAGKLKCRNVSAKFNEHLEHTMPSSGHLWRGQEDLV